MLIKVCVKNLEFLSIKNSWVLNLNIKQLKIIKKLTKRKIRLILSFKGFFLNRNILENKDNIKKKDAIAGAENKKKIPIFKVEKPNI